jgi:hypothetical protein
MSTLTRHASPLAAALLSAACTLFAASSATLLPAAPARAWWTCPTAQPDFQTRSTNPEHVRCIAETQYQAHDECPNATAMGQTIGTGIRRDYQGMLDKCVGFIGGSPVAILDPTCAGAGAGYVLERRPQPNADRCVKPGSSSAPTRNVN